MDERETEAAAVAVVVGNGASLLVAAVDGESLSVAANNGVSEPVAEIVAVDVGVPASADAVRDLDALRDGDALRLRLRDCDALARRDVDGERLADGELPKLILCARRRYVPRVSYGPDVKTPELD